MWTILHDGEFKTFASLGLSKPSRTILSQDADVVTFTRVGAAFDGDSLWAYGDTVIIKRNDAQWFLGRVTKTPRSGSAQNESQAYELQGPWFWLDHLPPFQQTWHYADGSGVAVTGSSSHIFLGQKVVTDPNGSGLPLGVPQTTAEQLSEILQWAINQGAPMQIGDLPTGINFLISEQMNIRCGDAIRHVLNNHPDAQTWFDYSTSPPTLHIKSRPAMTALDLPIGSVISGIQITAREDLQVPCVVLNFEQVHENMDGTISNALSVQKYPLNATGNELNTLVATINLEGVQIAAEKCPVKVALIECSEADWWASKEPWLRDPSVFAFYISNVQRKNTEDGNPSHYNFPNEIVDGQFADWVLEDHGYEEETITCDALVIYQDSNGRKSQCVKVLTASAKCTDLAVGERTLYRPTSITYGEPEPAGLAEALYNSMHPLQFEGAITLHEEEVNSFLLNAGISNSNGVGLVLNILGGRSEWATMRAMVTQVTEDLESGITTMTFGPAPHLGPDDLMQFLRMHQKRWIWTDPQARANKDRRKQGEMSLGKRLAQANSSAGPGIYSQIHVANGPRSIHQDSTGTATTLEVKETTSTDKIAKLEATTTTARSVLSDGTKTAERNLSHLPSWATDVRYRVCKICLNGINMLIAGDFSLAYDPETHKKYNPETGAEV